MKAISTLQNTSEATDISQHDGLANSQSIQVQLITVGKLVLQRRYESNITACPGFARIRTSSGKVGGGLPSTFVG